jgi:hypothetical protein
VGVEGLLLLGELSLVGATLPVEVVLIVSVLVLRLISAD